MHLTGEPFLSKVHLIPKIVKPAPAPTMRQTKGNSWTRRGPTPAWLAAHRVAEGGVGYRPTWSKR